MDDREAERQIQQMVNFILNEAKDKAEEIEAKALEDFNIEKLKLVQQMKDKIRGEYVRKAKQVDTQCAIARSTAINRSRLEKIKARQEVIGQVTEDVVKKLQEQLKQEAKHKKLITDLIAQGLLMLLEDEVVVHCRAVDNALVQGCLAEAVAKYSQVIKDKSGATKKCKCSIDTSKPLPGPPGTSQELHAKTCLGGISLSCQGGAIKVNNTIDERMKLTLEMDKPAIRSLLFPIR